MTSPRFAASSAAWPGMCLAVALFAGCERPASAPPERYLTVDAGGHRLRMLVVGFARKGRPTVVLESGWPGCGIGWNRVRGAVAEFAQVVTYDRAGTGGSEPGPSPRHAEQIAIELRTALRNAGIDPPFLLVGQSWGGPCIRVFASRYPEDVAGMVLVDPTQAEACEPALDVKRWLATNCPDQLDHVEQTLSNKAPPGFEVLLLSRIKKLEQGLAELPEPKRSRLRREWWSEIDSLPDVADTLRTLSQGAREEMIASSQTIEQAIFSKLPRVPILLLSAGQPDMTAAQAMSPAFRELNKDHRLGSTSLPAHKQWVDDTPGAKLLIVPDSGHNIQAERPQAVIDAIRQVFDK